MSAASIPHVGDPNDNRGPGVAACVSVLTSFSVITTIIRVGTRAANHQLGRDDAAITIATILAVVQWVFAMLEISYGYGRHAWTLEDWQLKETAKWSWALQVLLFTILPLVKISICFFILRIKNSTKMRWFLYTLIAGLIITDLPCIIVLFAKCQPLYATWDKKAGSCWDARIYNDVIWVQASYGILSDAICTILPVIVLWNVKIALKLKLAVCGLMSLGLIATACAAVRAYLSEQNNARADSTYSLILVGMWAYLEQNFAILGTNFALSRYVYIYFKYGKNGPPSRRNTIVRQNSYDWPSSRRNRSEKTDATQDTAHFQNQYGEVNGIAQRSSSFGSEIPLEADKGIRVTTQVEMTDNRTGRQPHDPSPASSEETVTYMV